LQDPPKFTQIGIFGLKISHLAILRRTWLDLKCSLADVVVECDVCGVLFAVAVVSGSDDRAENKKLIKIYKIYFSSSTR
jgi:hypothetical protein